MARLPPTSEITATQQSHHDEWAVIGTENCSLVASEVWSRDSIYPKWNQSSALSQFFLSQPLSVVKTLSHLYSNSTSTHTHISTVPWCRSLLCKMNRSVWIPISLNETTELFFGEIWQYVLPLFPRIAADKPVTTTQWANCFCLQGYSVPYHLIHQRGGGGGGVERVMSVFCVVFNEWVNDVLLTNNLNLCIVFFWILFISSCVFLLILPPVIGFLLFFVCPILFSFTSVFCSS